MGRASTKENKTPYQIAREELGLSREKASELLESIPPERIEKIESERSLPRADEVLVMAGKYKKPTLCNFYCSQQCSIGRQYVPRMEIKNCELPSSETTKDEVEPVDGHYIPYEDRLKCTPNEDVVRGHWNGERGESKFIPSEETDAGKAAKGKLAEKGMDGIEYIIL